MSKQQSNSYILTFSAIMTLVVGGLLAGVSTVLKPLQKEQEALDKQKQILASVMSLEGVEDISALYEQRIDAYVVDIDGNRIEGVDAFTVDVEKEFKNKKDPSDRQYPVFAFMNEGGTGAEAYVLPVFGNGLWDVIWGFVAVDTDLNTIKGVSLDHRGETPGLGARITTSEVQDRFKGTEVFDESGKVVAVIMLKGEGNPESAIDKHHVNGMSGATITGNGVTAMLQSYMSHYEGFLKKQAQASITVEENLADANGQ